MLVEMKPQFESVKSYYGKANIEISGSKRKLVSYWTYVAEYDHDNETLTINGEYSNTTLRHIKEFAQQLGFPKLSVSFFNKQMSTKSTNNISRVNDEFFDPKKNRIWTAQEILTHPTIGKSQDEFFDFVQKLKTAAPENQ